jgi:hypothetical protein
MKIDKDLAELVLEFLNEELDATRESDWYDEEDRVHLEEREFMFEAAAELVASVINEM